MYYVLAAIAAVAAGCEPATEPSPTPRASDPPVRIVSLSPELSRVLVELGVAPRVVAADSVSRALPSVFAAIDLGPPEAPDLARAAAMQPDFLFALESSPPRPAEDWQRAGAIVFAPRNANDVIHCIQQLGTLLGVDTRATAVVARMTREVSAVATARDGRERLTVAWLLARDPLVVVGGTGLLHELLELAGAENAFHDGEERTEVTAAELARRAPALLLDSTGHAAAPSAPIAPGIEHRTLPPELAALPALDLVGRVRQLHRILYPEATEERVREQRAHGRF